jgi:hypothetical protein
VWWFAARLWLVCGVAIPEWSVTFLRASRKISSLISPSGTWGNQRDRWPCFWMWIQCWCQRCYMIGDCGGKILCNAVRELTLWGKGLISCSIQPANLMAVLFLHIFDWLADWVAGWLTGWMTGWLNDWLADWMTDWLNDWLADWMTGWLTEWLTH